MKHNQLSGHGRIRIPIGEKKHVRGNPSGGWKLECLCGFSHGGFKNKRELEAAYVEHIQSSLPICNVCNEKKATREMSKSSATLCKKCSSAKSKQWSIDNPNVWERQKRKSHLKKKYGITFEDYDKMVIEQNNSCAICEGILIDSRGFRPHIDHCHETGKVRGVLCGDCNKALGMFKDSVERVQKAYNYLLKNIKK